MITFSVPAAGAPVHSPVHNGQLKLLFADVSDTVRIAGRRESRIAGFQRMRAARGHKHSLSLNHIVNLLEPIMFMTMATFGTTGRNDPYLETGRQTAGIREKILVRQIALAVVELLVHLNIFVLAVEFNHQVPPLQINSQ